MTRIVFLNGDFVPFEDARIPIMDRGFLFADGIYEVSAVLEGGLIDNEAHLARLDRSLGAIGIASPYSPAEWAERQTELVRRNSLLEGVVYIQVTRGVAEREFTFLTDLSPTVVMFTQVKTIIESPLAATGAAVITVPDIRWGRRDIKSIGLLAQALAKQQAAAAGAAEVIMVEGGFVTEGGSSTIFIIEGNAVVTRPLSTAVLPGVTRLAVGRLAADNGLRLEERAFTLDEALGAAEVFYTSASSFVTPIVSIDGKPVGGGEPGPLTRKLRQLYIQAARERRAPPV